jgi:hypothetical protein
MGRKTEKLSVYAFTVVALAAFLAAAFGAGYFVGKLLL